MQLRTPGRAPAVGFTSDLARLVGTLDAATATVATGAGPESITDAVRRYFDGDLGALDTIPTSQAGGPSTTVSRDEMRRAPVGRTGGHLWGLPVKEWLLAHGGIPASGGTTQERPVTEGATA